LEPSTLATERSLGPAVITFAFAAVAASMASAQNPSTNTPCR